MFTRSVLSLAVAALTYAGAASAQENATLVMKSGDRLAGQLVDLSGSGFIIQVSGQERQIPANDILVISFTGDTMTDADWAKLPAGGQVVVLKNGQTVSGQLYDIGGTRPLRITFRTASGDRDFSSGDVAHIVLARPANRVTPPAPPTLAPATGPGIVVPANRQWTATGVTFRQGNTLVLSTTGEVQLSTDAHDIAGAAGSKLSRYAGAAPLPRTLAGALIGRMGPNGTPFGIGNQTSILAPADGQLFLGINDDDVNDNRGEFRVEIRTAGGRSRR